MGCAHYFQAPDRLACSRLSDRGEDKKEKGTQKVGGAGKSFLPFYFRVCAASDPTISGPKLRAVSYFSLRGYCTRILSTRVANKAASREK